MGLGRHSDDAAVYKINDELALIATVDFFTPIVDDPYQYGAIAAANSLSDVYAMGGEIAFALNISCLSRCLEPEVVKEILRGGAEKVAEAGGVIAGGHSVDDEEPKYGLVAIGFIHPDRVLTKSSARPGDVLVLTKPLGVGMVATAFKGDQATPGQMEFSTEWMLKLNRKSSELLREGGVHACSDVTGFALIGHSCEIAERSGVQLRIHAGQVPFVPGAREFADLWLFPGGTGNNQKAYSSHVAFDQRVPEEVQNLLLTPETSGGLLAAVPPDGVDNLRASFQAAGEPLWVIGEVLPGGENLIEVIP